MLKTRKVILAITVTLTLAILAANVLGGQPKNTFLPTTGRWDVRTNWSLGRVPTKSDYAVIPSGKTVTVAGLINDNQNFTGSIVIHGTVEGTSVTFEAKKIIIGVDGKIIAHNVTLNVDKVEIKGEIKLPDTPKTDGGSIKISAISVVIRWTADLKASDSGDKKGGSISISATTILVEPYARIIAGSSVTDGIGHTKLVAAKWISTSKRSDIKDGNDTKPEPYAAPKVILTVMGPIPASGRVLISLPATPLIDPESIDGEITIDDIVDEGAQLHSTDLVGPGLSYPITIFTKQDGEFLYVGIEINDLPFSSWEEFLNAGAREVYVASDVNQDGEQFTDGDNILIWDLDREIIMDGFYPYDLQFASDTDFGGTHDVVGAAHLFLPFSADNATLSVEFLVPLDSGDRIGADPALGPGDEIDIKIGLVFDTFELETQEHLILGILL
jgi:hypothetical protein